MTAPSRTVLPGGAVVYTWDLVAGQTGDPVDLVDFADRTIQVSGDFGVGGSITFEGTIDLVSYGTLSEPGGSPAIITTSKVMSILEVTRSIRPRCSGDGSTSLKASILLRKNIP